MNRLQNLNGVLFTLDGDLKGEHSSEGRTRIAEMRDLIARELAKSESTEDPLYTTAHDLTRELERIAENNTEATASLDAIKASVHRAFMLVEVSITS
jgi:hypothetical protein